MTRKKSPNSLAVLTVQPPGDRELKKIIPAEAFQKLPFWKKLTEKEQEEIQTESQQLAAAMMSHGGSALAIGAHLTALQEILEPKGQFGKILKAFHFSRRTAYRYVAGYKNATKMLPPAVLKVAMARGIRIIGDTEDRPLGRYTEVVKLLPPPRNPDPEQAADYLNRVEKMRLERKHAVRSETSKAEKAGKAGIDEITRDPNILLQSCYRYVNLQFRRLPNNARVRRHWLDNLFGMLLTDLGVSSPQTFEPIAIPEGFRAKRGRPRLHLATESASA